MQWAAYLALLCTLATAAFLKPAPEDFDRYVYEAILRTRAGEPLDSVYQIVRHDSPRAQASSLLETPELMAHQEPFYTSRPVYLAAIRVVKLSGLSYQESISALSALAYIGIGVIMLLWTRQFWLTALLAASPAVLDLARHGIPDALSTLVLLAACLSLVHERWKYAGLALLVFSIWVRTDNVLLVVAVALCFGFRGLLPWKYAALAALAAVFSVLWINHVTGNYGWAVLFRRSFLGWRDPVTSLHYVTIREYAGVMLQGIRDSVAHSQASLWLLVAGLFWHRLKLDSTAHTLLIATAFAAITRFAMFPVIEDRYFAAAYLIVGCATIATTTGIRYASRDAHA